MPSSCQGLQSFGVFLPFVPMLLLAAAAAAGEGDQGNWYTNSFFLLHEDYVVHMVNLATGERTTAPKRNWYVPVSIHRLPVVPACRLSLRAPRQPVAVFAQPGDVKLDDWRYADGRVEVTTPQFNVHQMIVIRFGRPP